MAEVTPDDAAQFERYVQQWQQKLNLHDWRIQRRKGFARGAMADVALDYGSRMALWRLGKSFGADPVNAYTLESTALHELLHVLLAEYRETVMAKVGEELLEAAEHRVIHTLERLLVPPPENV